MRKHVFFLGICLTGCIALVFYHSLLFNLQKPLGLLHGDSYLVSFIFQHYFSVFQTGRWGDLATLPMFYGFKNSLFYSDHHLIHALLAYPLFLITKDVIATTNLYVLLTIVTSAIAMYLFLWYLTKDVTASVIGAIVFTCNPFVTARFPDQLILLSLQWIPLMFLFFERFLQRKRALDGFFFFAFLSCQLLSSLYYSAFLSVVFPVYALVRILQTRTGLKVFLRNRGVWAGAVLFGITAFFSAFFYFQVFSKEPINRSLDQAVATYAARVSDYFFTAPNNVLYGSLKEYASNTFPTVVRLGIWSEHNLFWGITVFLLFALSFLLLWRTEKWAYWLLCVSLIAFCALLSFGPKIVITDSFALPGPYTIFYYLDPLLQFIRTTARFGVFVFFFLSVIVTLALHEIFQLTKKWQYVLGGVVLFCILLEYWVKPLDFFVKNSNDQSFYSKIESNPSVKVLIDLPIGNLIPYSYKEARSEDLDAHYLLYGVIYHHKTLFNGYTGFLPREYYKRSEFLSVQFPTSEKLMLLRKWGVDAIVLHEEEFNDTNDYAVIKAKLQAKGLQVLAETRGMIAFKLPQTSR